MSPARAMIWKEFRENGKWAALGMLAMSVGLGWVLIDHASRFRFRDYAEYQSSGTPLLSDPFQAVVIVGSAVIALLIALAQTLPEKRLDQWAFLVHRPVPRSKLIGCKVAAGLMLYFFAVVMPVAVSVIWVAMPNHVPAPFVAGMATPSIIDVLAGVAYYFAGLVIGLRDARWYGSRILVLGAPIAASLLAFFIASFTWAMLPPIVAIALLATAAWGAFVAGGQYARQAWPAKVSLGASLFVGVLMLGGVAVAAISNSFPRRWGILDNRYYSLLADGSFVAFHQVGEKFVEATDLQGKPVPEALLQAHGAHENPYADATLSLDVRDSQSSYDKSWYRRLQRYVEVMESTEDESWYYLQDAGYGVGYSRLKRMRVGTFGPAGFSPVGESDPPDVRFDGRTVPIRGWHIYPGYDTWLTFRSASYEIDSAKRRVVARLVPPPGEQLVSVSIGQEDEWHGYRRNAKPPKLLDAYVTDKTLGVFESKGKMLFTIPLEHTRAQGFRAVTVAKRGTNPERFFVMYAPEYEAANKPTLVTELNESGTAVARLELPMLPHKDYGAMPVRWEMVFTYSMSPPVFQGYRIYSAWRHVGADAIRWMWSDATSKAVTLGALLSGLISSWLSVLIARRQGASRRIRIAWAILNFLLGLAGVVTMLCLAALPMLETCPGCGKRRFISTSKCPRCDAPFAGPALDGTEVFAA